MAKVYWIKGRSRGAYESIVSKISALLNLDEMARLVVPDESLAIKDEPERNRLWPLCPAHRDHDTL